MAVEATRGYTGRGADDHERLFPKYSVASVAPPDEVSVNGKKLRIWEYSQLEALSVPILKQRMQTIRDAVGEDYCPPLLSSQRNDIIRWILHLQSQITCTEIQPGRRGAGVPQHLLRDVEERPITQQRQKSSPTRNLPFGPKKIQHEATRDHYDDLLKQKKEFAGFRAEGIQTLRVGGEGRRHLFPQENMDCFGVAASEPKGIQSLKGEGEGRRYLSCVDHLVDMGTGGPPPENIGIQSWRPGGEGARHIHPEDCLALGLAPTPSDEPQILAGGERKRHIQPKDSMMNFGVADTQPCKNEIEAGQGHGRRFVDQFHGPSGAFSGTNPQYSTGWKADPSRLQGGTLII